MHQNTIHHRRHRLRRHPHLPTPHDTGGCPEQTEIWNGVQVLLIPCNCISAADTAGGWHCGCGEGRGFCSRANGDASAGDASPLRHPIQHRLWDGSLPGARTLSVWPPNFTRQLQGLPALSSCPLVLCMPHVSFRCSFLSPNFPQQISHSQVYPPPGMDCCRGLGHMNEVYAFSTAVVCAGGCSLPMGAREGSSMGADAVGPRGKHFVYTPPPLSVRSST